MLSKPFHRRSMTGATVASHSDGPPADTSSNSRAHVLPPKPGWRRASTFPSAGASVSAEKPPPTHRGAAPSPASRGRNGTSTRGAATATPPGRQPHCAAVSVLTSTTAEIAGHAVTRALGTLHGTTTGALPKDGVKFWLKAQAARGAGMGAEVRNLTNLLYTMRGVATERMVLDCVSRGGNAVVGLSFMETEIMGCITVSVQGTAVVVEELPRGGVREAQAGKGEGEGAPSTMTTTTTTTATTTMRGVGACAAACREGRHEDAWAAKRNGLATRVESFEGSSSGDTDGRSRLSEAGLTDETPSTTGGTGGSLGGSEEAQDEQEEAFLTPDASPVGRHVGHLHQAGQVDHPVAGVSDGRVGPEARGLGP